MTRQRTLAPRRATYLPNASTLGYGQYKARPGDYILFTEGPYSGASAGTDTYRTEAGRVLGQIIQCDSDGEDCRGYLAVALIAQEMTFGYERWIRPSDVKTCLPPERVAPFMRAILNADVKQIQAALAANGGILAANADGTLWTGEQN